MLFNLTRKMENNLTPKTLVDENNENMHRIKPCAINTAEENQPDFEAVFPSKDSAEQARLLCHFLKQGGIWRSFTDEELTAEYGEKFRFNSLVDGPNNGDVHYDDNHVMRVTHGFICKCFSASGRFY